MTTGIQLNQVNLLNAQGLEVLDAKRVYMENLKNPIIRDGILASFNTAVSMVSDKSVQESIRGAMTNEKMSVSAFESLLYSVRDYINTEVADKMFGHFQGCLSRALEGQRVNHFTAEVAVEKGGILIVKKLGVSDDTFKREFRLESKEAKKLLTSTFGEKYAMLKLTAVTKDLISLIERNCKYSSNLEFEISPLYKHEKLLIFNQDFRILIRPTEKQLNEPGRNIDSLIKEVASILEFVQKQYYRHLIG